MDYNVYFNPTAQLADTKFNGLSWSDWQKNGKDNHSLYADPLFENPEKFDFKLKPNSPAFALGFKPINMEEVGPRKNPALNTDLSPAKGAGNN